KRSQCRGAPRSHKVKGFGQRRLARPPWRRRPPSLLGGPLMVCVPPTESLDNEASLSLGWKHSTPEADYLGRVEGRAVFSAPSGPNGRNRVSQPNFAPTHMSAAVGLSTTRRWCQTH